MKARAAILLWLLAGVAGAQTTIRPGGGTSSGSGVTPATLNDATYCPDVGASDAYVCSMVSAPSSYAAGMLVTLSANTANTGTATVNVNSLGVKTIVRSDGTTLQTGDITAGMVILLKYDGTNFRAEFRSGTIISPAGGVTIRSDTYASGSDVGLTVQCSLTGNCLNIKNSAGTNHFEVRSNYSVQLGGATSDRWLLITGLGGASGYQGTITYPTDFVIGIGTNTVSPTAILSLAGFSSRASFLKGGQSYTGVTLQVGDDGNNALGKNIIGGTEYALTSGTATEVVTVGVASGSATGGTISYTVFASDGTEQQSRSGQIRFSIVNKAGTETCNIYGVDSAFTVNPNETQDGSGAGAFSSGTLTYTWSADTSGTNQCVLKLAATSSLGAPPSTLRMNFNAHLFGPGTMTNSTL